MHWIFIAQFLMAWMLAVMRPESVNDMGSGFQYGIYAGVFLGAVNFINYAIQPMTLNITFIVFVADIVMVALGMAVLAMVANKLASKD